MPEFPRNLRERVAVGDVHTHQANVGVLEQVALRVVRRIVIHRTVVEPGFENRAGARPTRMVVEVLGLILSITAPGEIALDLAVLIPPAVPPQQRVKCVLKKPAIVELAIEPENRDGSDGRLGAIRTLPPPGPRVI